MFSLACLTVPIILIYSKLALAESLKACSSPLDCSLNGECSGGLCHCDAAWSGAPGCDVLAVEAAPLDNGYHNLTFASWGGNAIYQDGLWHLFVAQIVNHCGLDRWGSNSEIVRAESQHPGGPYTMRETVVAPFAHNPTVRNLLDGGVLLFFLGYAGGKPVNCSDSTNSSVRSLRDDIQTGIPTLTGSRIFAMHSPFGVRGPWSSPREIEFEDDPAWSAGGTNPSPVIDPKDGSVTLAIHRVHSTDPGKALLGIARAATWEGPYHMLSPMPITPQQWFCVAGQGEDPFLWQNARGYHLLYHGMCPTGVMQAHYAFSADAVTWVTATKQSYSYRVHFEDGSSRNFARMERPQLIFDPNTGMPTHIVNGVCDGSTAASSWECVIKQGGMTWTVIRPLASSSAFDEGASLLV